jgi:predicted phage-related endonuclease
MANSRADFEPSVRNAALWATDARLLYSGKLSEVVLQKQGRLTPPDLSDVEPVKMGHVMQPVVAQIFSEETGIKLSALDEPIYHKKHAWLASHFDYVTEDRSALVEVKNYNAAAIQLFGDPDADPLIIPDADFAQCLHEATVYGCDVVYLAVLFGGQRFRSYKLTFSEAEKEEHIKHMAEAWGYIQAQADPPADSTAAARKIFQADNGSVAQANKVIENLCVQLQGYKQKIKELEGYEEQAQAAIMQAMGSASTLASFDGKVLATWKASKPSKRFSAELFKSSMPDVYEKFVVEQPGARRFLLK